MSKLYDTYIVLKKQNPDTIYLFKSGIFFIALDKDAYLLSNTFNLKLSKLNEKVDRCGFPCSSLAKYSNLFKSLNLDFKIIDSSKNTLYLPNEYSQNNLILDLISTILQIDTSTLSITEAYEFIEKLKEQANNIDNLIITRKGDELR